MGFSFETSVSVVTVFLQGLFSFFSPCVLPLVPLYLGYLAGGASSADLSDKARRRVTMKNTVFFILGVSFAFFMLGMGFTTLGRLLSGNRAMVARIGGILIMLLGLYQVGFLKMDFLQKEHRLPFNLEKFSMNPITALVLGFTFSFAWTPCVGPALTSVLVMAGSAASRTTGFVLIGVYTLGFVLPFLLVGFFTSQVLSFFRKHTNWLKYTAKVGGVLLMLMGLMMFTGWMNTFTGYLSGLGGSNGPVVSQSQSASSDAVESQIPDSSSAVQSQSESAPESVSESASDSASASSGESDYPVIPAPDFTMVDQYGNTHTLSDYKGKTVFLNFWATWCSPCKKEMPDIQQLYLDHGENSGDVIILGIAAPKSDFNLFNQETKTADEIAALLEQSGFTYPVLMDTTGAVMNAYGIQAFPTTFMIDDEGNVFGYLRGGMTRPMMDSIIEQTISGVRAD